HRASTGSSTLPVRATTQWPTFEERCSSGPSTYAPEPWQARHRLELLTSACAYPLELSPIITSTARLAAGMTEGRFEGIVLKDWQAPNRGGSRLGVAARGYAQRRPVRDDWRFRRRAARPRCAAHNPPITECSAGSPLVPSCASSRYGRLNRRAGPTRGRPPGLALDAPTGGSVMPRFITFFSYTAESAKAMIERPSDRSAAAKALVESLGGTQEAFYWMQGKHDGFLITSLPDGVAAAALAAAVGATGA